MTPTRRAKPSSPALTDEQVDALRHQVARGDQPRVVVRSASTAVPAGSRGPVVRVGDPSREPEFIVVRLRGDDIPFAPSELGLPGRASGSPDGPSGGRGRKAAAGTAAKRSRKPAAGASAPAAEERPAAGRRARAAAARTPRSRPGRRRGLLPLSVTLHFAGDSWTVEATRGGRRLGRKAPMRPGAVRAIADLIEDEQISEAVAQAVEACRDEVAMATDALREQLRAAEAVLAQFDR